MRRVTIAILVSILVGLLGSEALLRVFDPWRVQPWYADTRTMWQALQADAVRGYALTPGVHVFSNWTATILPDGSRAVPDTNLAAPCTLVLAGDSVTFGHGVSDAETWANLVARDLPGVHIVNPALDGYDAAQALAIVERWQADAYLYLYQGNDDQPPHDWQGYQARAESGSRPMLLRLYIFFATGDSGGSYVPDPRFYGSLDALAARRDTIMVGVKGDYRQAELSTRYSAMRWIADWTSRISRADPHADVAGNREIAAGMLPIAEELVKKNCRSLSERIPE